LEDGSRIRQWTFTGTATEIVRIKPRDEHDVEGDRRESYYVSINTTRGAVTAQTTPQMYLFNHEILAIRLLEDLKDASLTAIYQDPKLGRILIFDPTDELTPLGQLRGELQANDGLLVTADGGELIELPLLDPSSSGILREAKLALSDNGTLSGEVVDVRVGDYATLQRYAHKVITKKEDQIKPIETLLAHSVGTYQITKASIGNLDVRDQPFQYNYTFVVPSYAKAAGELLLLRPRVLGEKSSDILEKKEARKYPVEFEGPRKDTDRIEIALPQGFEVENYRHPRMSTIRLPAITARRQCKGSRSCIRGHSRLKK
jgi:hypothetical protein